MSDFEYQIPETYDEAVKRKADVLQMINDYNVALLLGNDLPYSEEEIEKLQEEYQILNDLLALTEEERLAKLKDSDKEVNEDGVVVEKISVFDKMHWGILLYCVFTFISLCSMPFLTKLVGQAGIDSFISKYLYDCLWEKNIDMLALQKSEFMWTPFDFWSRVAVSYLWLPLLLVLISVVIYFLYYRKHDLNTKIAKWLIIINVFIFVLSIGVVLLQGEIKVLQERFEYLWYEYAEYYYTELGSN
jgi:hypothetical protein